MKVKGYSFTKFERLDSTNDFAKQLAKEGVKEKTVVICKEQSNGKGRAGRTFYSPRGNNIYMSIVLRPMINVQEAQLITVLAASCAALAIEQVANKTTEIKWVNDIFLDNKKIAGILAETVSGGVSDKGIVEALVLGIGINVFEARSIPSELIDIYGSIYNKDEMIENDEIRQRITDDIIDKFLELFDTCYTGIKCRVKSLEVERMIKEYKWHSIIIGRDVTYLTGNDEKTIHVVDIDDEGSLVVLNDDGSLTKYRDGEIRIKVNQ